jgi:1-acyl-sn-glycerol-3-phosphate acyltransferase
MAFWYNLGRSILKIYIALLVDEIRVYGLENITAGPKIIVANHANATDGFVLPFIFPDKLHYMIQGNVFEVPFIGRLLAGAEQIPVIAGKGRQALAVAREKLLLGDSVVIFPEGRLNNDQGLYRGHVGAAMLAAKTNVPILPLGFYVPPDALRVIEKKIEDRIAYARWQLGGSCFIRVGQPLQVSPYRQLGKPSGTLREFTEQIMAHIGDLVEQAKKDAADWYSF